MHGRRITKLDIRTAACVALVLSAGFGCGKKKSSSPNNGNSVATVTPSPSPAATPAVASPNNIGVCGDATTGSSLGELSTSGDNTMTVTVAGPSHGCGFNVACTSVTICAPGSTTLCQTIPNIAIDTGSTGLRLFASALNSQLCDALTQTIDGDGNAIWEGQQLYGTQTWGSIYVADIQLAGEPPAAGAVNLLSAQVPPPAAFAAAPAKPATAPYRNGILGVSNKVVDCGAACSAAATVSTYYSCSGKTCVLAAVSLADQVRNPVSLLATDHNGVLLELPALSEHGEASVSGTLLLGIGTRGNNSAAGEVALALKDESLFSVSAFGQTYASSALVSGAPCFGIPTNAGLPACGDDAGFYCPASPVNTTAVTTSSVTPTQTTSVELEVADMDALAASGQAAVSTCARTNLNTTLGPTGLVFGLPFFFGKRVFIGIDGAQSPLGTGPLAAF